MTQPRTLVCAYGPCPVSFVPTKPWHAYHDRRCRMADWKRRAGYVDPRRPHGDRNASGAGSSGTSGPQASFRRAVAEVAADYEETFRLSPTTARLHAERVVARALPARQRARLKERAS